MSTRDESAVRHENGLALFVSREWRRRFRESLADDRRRKRLLNKLHHFRHLDARFAEAVPSSAQTATALGAMLRDRGAPSVCYLVSNDSEFDGREFTLEEALSEIVEAGSDLATFISCVPGRLAYFHDEETGNRYLLERSE